MIGDAYFLFAIGYRYHENQGVGKSLQSTYMVDVGEQLLDSSWPFTTSDIYLSDLKTAIDGAKFPMYAHTKNIFIRAQEQ